MSKIKIGDTVFWPKAADNIVAYVVVGKKKERRGQEIETSLSIANYNSWVKVNCFYTLKEMKIELVALNRIIEYLGVGLDHAHICLSRRITPLIETLMESKNSIEEAIKEYERGESNEEK